MEKKWKLIISFLIFLLVVVTGGSQYVLYKKSHLVCSAVIYHSEHYDPEVFSYQTVNKLAGISEHFVNNVTGRAYAEDKVFTLNRTVTFSYTPVKGFVGSFRVRVTDVRKSGVDNVPDEVAAKFMPSVSPGAEQIMHLSRLPSGDILVTSALGPFFICDVDGDHR